MLRSGKNGTVRTFVPACSARGKEMYLHYASGLYRQAFLTLGDSALAVHVVRDVIADECALPPAPEFNEDDARHRLAESVFRRRRRLAADRARHGCVRHCSGWQPLRPPMPRTAVKATGPSADPRQRQEKSDADTRIRHGDHHGSGRSRARGAGGQVAAGCATVRGDDEDVTRVGTERGTKPMSHAGPRA
jgi:hypothetical protein